MKLQNQSGFAAIETVLVIVILAIVGFTGYYVWHSQKQADKALNLGSAAAQIAPKQKSALTKYLVIKEWGVKVPLSTGDAGAYYQVSDSTSPVGGNPTYLNVYSSEADDITGPSGKTCKGEYIAFIMRLPTSDPLWQGVNDDDSTSIQLFTERKQIGDYTYAIATKKQYGPECFNAGSASNYQVDAPTADKFQAVVNAFKVDFQKIAAN